jgi:glycosyltransferase involved in cell wall biosynthesis
MKINTKKTKSMKVLFISSGNRKQGLNPIIHLQAKSLEKQGIEIEHFLIFGKGFSGYLKNVFKLRKFIKKNPFDIVHAHFGFTCVVAQLGKSGLPLVVTLMGTDILGHKNEDGSVSNKNKLVLWINHFFANHIYTDAIVMNDKMKGILSKRSKPTYILSNGVDTDLFKEVPKEDALAFLGWERNVHHFIFISNPQRPEKNYALAHDAVELMKQEGHTVKLHAVFQEKSENLKYYYSAATALVLSSFHEGSPNVVKEAFCCNCPIVSTDIGDVAVTTKGLQGCFIAPFEASGFADALKKAIIFSTEHGRISGRQRIQEMGFDSEVVALKIIEIYKKKL